MRTEGAKRSQILRDLKSEIFAGRYVPTAAFPSEIALSRRYKVSRGTIAFVVEELEREGLVRRRRGSGTFVTWLSSSRKIGVIVPGIAYSEFFPPIVSEITRLAQERGYTVFLGDMDSSSARERAVRARHFAMKLVAEKVGGVIYHPLEFLANAERINRDIVSIFDKADIPVVLLDNDMTMPPGRSKYDVVGINDHDAGFRLANHLIEQGARNIHFLMRPYWAVGCHNRLYGMVTAVTSCSKRCSYGVLTAEPDDVMAVRRYVRRCRPDAFICGNDMSAARLKQTLEELGYAVPRDLMLAGFDDVQIASLLSPPLTTIRNPCQEIGRKAFETLVFRMEQPDAPQEEVLLPAPLIVRGSTSHRMPSLK